MRKIAPIFLVWFICLLGQPANATGRRWASLEWWTNISDTVTVAEVVGTKKIEPLNEYWQSQEVRCTPTGILKGERLDAFTLRQDYPYQKYAQMRDATTLRPAAKVLLFCARPAGSRRIDVIFWVNLTKPDGKSSSQAAYNNSMKWLKHPEEIVAIVKARIARENPHDRTKKRGLIVPFALAAGTFVTGSWDFVRTADPEYKKVLIEELRHGDKESAIYNLISYPGKQTRDLIRPFLKDAETSELHVIDGIHINKEKVVTIYPVRQAAYSALKLLGESPAKPKGYYSGHEFFLFVSGFEHRSYFPYGDWKRVEN